MILSKSFAGEIRDNALAILENSYNSEVQILTYKLPLSQSFRVDSERFAKQKFFGKFV